MPSVNVFHYIFYWIILSVGSALIFWWSLEAFDAPVSLPESPPILPKYAARRLQYRLAKICFALCCVFIYAVIADYLRDIVLIPRLLLPEGVAMTILSDTLISDVITLAGITILFLGLIRYESDFNPLVILKTLIYRSVGIPRQVKELLLLAALHLSVPKGARNAISSSNLNVDLNDFEKDRDSIDRMWAEICYIYKWLDLQRTHGHASDLFNEPSSTWPSAQRDFSDLVRRLVFKHPRLIGDIDSDFAESISRSIFGLRTTLCRITGCYLVYMSPSRSALLSNARAFGIGTTRLPSEPLQYFPELPAATVNSVGLEQAVKGSIEVARPAEKVAEIVKPKSEQGHARQFLSYATLAKTTTRQSRSSMSSSVETPFAGSRRVTFRLGLHMMTKLRKRSRIA
jgi:hypothetical protein